MGSCFSTIIINRWKVKMSVFVDDYVKNRRKSRQQNDLVSIPSIAALSFISLLGLRTSSLIEDIFTRKEFKLENEVDCGVTTGGKEECYWDCEVVIVDNYPAVVRDPECLRDCFPKKSLCTKS